MRIRFETFYRGLLVFLACMVWFSFYAMAQQQTNAPASTNAPTATAASTNSVSLSSQLLRKVLPEEAITLGLDHFQPLKHTLFDIPLWQYLASLIYIFLAFYISKAIDFFIRKVVKRWTAKTETKFDDVLVTMVHGPVKIISFVIFLHIGLSIFQWPEWLEKFISKGLKIGVAISITVMLLRVVDALLGFWRDHQESSDDDFNKQLFPIIRKTVKVFITVIAILVTAQQLDFNITALLASLSVGGLALGLAAQDTVANLFGAVSVFLDKPFKVGERIQWENFDGVVETIGLRSTRVRNADGHLITVPNKTMGNTTITNVNQRPNIRTTINIGLTYDTPAEKIELALKILEEIFKKHPNTQDVWLSFNRFDASSLNLFVIHWWNNTDYKAYLAGIQQMNLAIKRRFDAEKLNFAFPTQTIYMKQDSEWRMGGAEPQAPAAKV